MCERASVGYLSATSTRLTEGEAERDDGEGAVRLGRGVVIEAGAIVEARSVGEGTVVEVGARVGRGCVVGKVCSPFPPSPQGCVLRQGRVGSEMGNSTARSRRWLPLHRMKASRIVRLFLAREGGRGGGLMGRGSRRRG